MGGANCGGGWGGGAACLLWGGQGGPRMHGTLCAAQEIVLLHMKVHYSRNLSHMDDDNEKK